jgi:micrococcal nuclease
MTVLLVGVGVLVFAGLYNRWSIGDAEGVSTDGPTPAGTETAEPEEDGDEPGVDENQQTPTVTEETVTGTVVYVIDGDTVDMEINGERERVRLLGIDAPESVHRSVPEQCFGAESAAALTELLPIGSQLILERDEDPRDRYGRLLLYLYRSEDGLFVNEWLVRNGLADTSFFEPNTALADTLTEARAEARSARTGLWGSCDGPDQPLD